MSLKVAVPIKLIAKNEIIFPAVPNAAKKFAKHAKEFTSMSDVNVYYKRAAALADSKVGGDILGFTNRDGWVFKMNSKTGEFLTIKPGGQITTFYRRLEEPLNYWAEQIAKHGK